MPTQKRRQFYLALSFISFLVLCDQFSKILISYNFSYGEERVIFPWLSLLYTHNKGIAFSLFSSYGPWPLIILTSITSLAISGYFFKILPTNPFTFFSFCFILGGALGNLIDRSRLHYVIDFIYFHINGLFSFAIFNLADILINIGVVLFLVNEIILKPNKYHKK